MIDNKTHSSTPELSQRAQLLLAEYAHLHQGKQDNSRIGKALLGVMVAGTAAIIQLGDTGSGIGYLWVLPPAQMVIVIAWTTLRGEVQRYSASLAALGAEIEAETGAKAFRWERSWVFKPAQHAISKKRGIEVPSIDPQTRFTTYFHGFMAFLLLAEIVWITTNWDVHWGLAAIYLLVNVVSPIAPLVWLARNRVYMEQWYREDSAWFTAELPEINEAIADATSPGRESRDA